MLKLLLLIGLVLCLMSQPVRAEDPRIMQLVSREQNVLLTFDLPDNDWRWLGEKREVSVAIYAPENPPFDMVIDANTLEGISADYTALVLHYLGLHINTHYYSSRSAALDALELGKVDMLVDSAGSPEPTGAELLLSTPFASDYPAMVSRDNTTSEISDDNSPMQIAMPRGYLSDAWIEARYPEAKITRYPSALSALASLAFGENDYFIGNLNTANYLIERNYASTLSVIRIFEATDAGPRFVFPIRNAPLYRGVNAVLNAIPLQQHKAIFHQWVQSMPPMMAAPPLQLTDRERRWLAQHQTMRVVMNPLDAPFTLKDRHNKFNGMTADLLRLIHLRTGIDFTMVEASSVNAMFDRLSRHEVELVGSLAHSPQREARALFSRPYVLPPYVLVSKNTLGAPKSLNDTDTLAITPQHELIGWLKENFPHIKLVTVENASIALQMVNEGRVDSAVNNLIAARYMIDRYFSNRLQIVSRLGENPARISFAVGRDNPELLSILNKVLATIPPRDISLLAMKWQGTPDVKLDTWMAYRHEFYWLAGIFAVLVITSLFWNYHLHRAVRQRKEAQARLQEQATFQKTLFNGTPVPIYVIDHKGEMTNKNPAWSQFFNDPHSNISQLPLSDSAHPLHAICQAQMALLAEQTSLEMAPQRGQIDNGHELRDVIHRAVAFRDNHGNLAGMICSWQDVTEHEQLTRDLLQASERAEQANRTKSTFLATMSHEIRTPISAIIGLLELAVANRLQQPCDKESVRVAYESAQSLMGLIGDILDMAKIESGKLELSPEWVRFDTLAEPVVRVFEGLARQKGLLLHYQIDVLHPDELLLDPMRLRQILSNLISNAIKFTERGTVEVQVRSKPGEGDRATLELTVQDTGIGISEEDQQLIFNPYEQSASGKKQSGTGLGLAICEQMVAMMAGSLTLHSQPGRGTRICVRIPVDCREAVSAPVEPIRQQDACGLPLTILTVDDHPANRLLLKRQLTRLGHKVIEAEDGEQALWLWQENQIDLVITDCSMPVMDGFTLTRELRKKQREPLTIMGLTANAQPEERSRCLEAGMDDCLFKPLRLPQLEALLQRVPRPTVVPYPGHVALNHLLDLNALRELAHQDNEMLQRLLSATRDENLQDMQVACACFDNRDWPALERSLHRLAGSVQIIGAVSIADQCRELEQACSAPADERHLGQMLDETLGCVHVLNQAIETFLKDEFSA